MGKTNFTFVGFIMLLLLSASMPTPVKAGQYSLANLCQIKNLTVHNGDLIKTDFQANQCNDKSGNENLAPGQYHCQSITKIYSAEPNQLLSINFLSNYIIGYQNDDIITGRLLILNGIVDVPLTSVSCSNLNLGSSPFEVNPGLVLFDSYKDGSQFDSLSITKISSTAKGGGLTVVVLLLSTDLGSFPFTISMVPTPDVVCDLSCIDQVNISLDQACSRTITPYDVDLTCTFSPGLDPDRYEIVLQYNYPELYAKYGRPDKVGPELIGQKIVYRLRDSITGNSCWGHIKIEDKYPPIVNRVTRDTIACLDDAYLDNIQVSVNACDSYYGFPGRVQFLSKKFQDFDCDDPLYSDFVGRIFREFRVTDLWGNGGTYKDTIYLWRLSASDLVCPPDTFIDCSKIIVQSDGTEKDILWSDERFYSDAASGLRHPYPTEYQAYPSDNCEFAFPAPGIEYQIPGHPLDTAYLDGKSLGKCNIVVKYEDMVFKTCGSSYKIRRWWTIYDWCTNLDTSCVQWIKITDTTEPTVDHDHLALNYYRQCTTNPQGALTECVPGLFKSDAVTEDEKPYFPMAPCKNVAASPNWQERFDELISTARLYKDVVDDDNKSEDEYFILHPIGKFNVREHECSAHVSFPDFKQWLDKNSCRKEVKVFYSVEYDQDTHPGKTITQHGEVTPNGFIYLPAGWHCVLITFRDDCWNESSYWWRVAVYDNTPPTAVCDAHTVVTLDPHKCWARIEAQDLNDGSHDNCCQELHFAVAAMDSVTHWTEHWEDYFHTCLGADAYYKHIADGSIKEAIDEWINCFVFSDYIDVTGCGPQMVVMRVYEVCGAPHYDPHIFKGSKHQWYWYNLSDNYAGWFHWNYDQIRDQYVDVPRVGLFCDYTCNDRFNVGWDVPYANWCVYKDDDDYDGVYRKSNVCSGTQEVSSEHGPYRNHASWTFETAACDPTPTDEDWKNYEGRVDRETRDFLRVIADLRYAWPVRWNECMVEIEKQDKVAPVCSAPADVTVYCDGVPYAGYIQVGRDSVYFNEANDAWKICDESDDHSNGCALDNSTAEAWHTATGGSTTGDLTREWCYKSGPVLDKYGHAQGYYSAPPAHNYSGCGEGYKNIEGDWQPIYCRLWLLLDQYDTGTRIHASDYLGDDEDVDVIECSGYDIFHEDEEKLNECGVGTVTRTWKVTEQCEPGRSTYCYQKLTIKGRSDFEVCFPKDLVVDCSESAGLTPNDIDAAFGEFAGTPFISDDDCELIGIHYEDQDFGIVTSEEGTCRKIIRVWTIVDWCIYNPDTKLHAPDVIVDDRETAGEQRSCVYRCLKDDGDGYMTYIQIIRIKDDKAPEIACNELEVGQITGVDCNKLTVERDLGKATDACTPEDHLKYRWSIKGTNLKGNGNIMTVDLAPGQYTVVLYASDRCGNESNCETTLVVKDSKAPTPYCYSGIATVLMSISGSLDVWAKDLDAGSFDNCVEDKLRFTFSEVAPEDDPDYDPSQGSSKRVFTCEDLGENKIQIWVWDASGNADFCEATLLIQQGTSGCTDISTSMVLGEIKTELNDAVEFAEVTMKENTSTLNTMVTGVDGKYVIANLPKNHLYSMAVQRNDDHVNGISTLDIVHLQKHVLGVEALNSPYKIIAGDVDNNHQLSAVDIVTLRRLVLGIDEGFKKNTSWKFILKSFIFANPAAPFDFPEPYKMPSMEQTEVKVDFIGVKIGDLNLTAIPNSSKLNSIEIREYQPLIMQVEDQFIPAGEPVQIKFYAKDFYGIQGYQFTLEGEGLVINNLAGLGLDVQTEHFGWPRQSHQLLTSSWSQPVMLDLNDGTPLFSATVVAEKAGQLSKMLQLTSTVTPAESYRFGQNNPLVLKYVAPGGILTTSGLSLFQNTPNPFADETAIGFTLPERSEATIKIMDIHGKVIKLYEGTYSKGYHEIKLNRRDIALPQGVLYYTIDNKKASATRKMILID